MLPENADRSRKTHLPIKNPEAGEAYLVTKPSSSEYSTEVSPYSFCNTIFKLINTLVKCYREVSTIPVTITLFSHTGKVAIDPYKWTQKGWQPIPRKSPVILWRWGLMRHRKLTWAPPLIRIDYVHVSCNNDLMLVHYLPTKDNQNMLEINSAIVPVS